MSFHRRPSASTGALFLLTTLAACGGDGGNGPGNHLVVSPATVAIADCQTQQVIASVRNADGDLISTSILLAPRDTTIASVSPAGIVTGQGAGTTYIIATAGGLKDSIAVSVTAGPVIPGAPDSLLIHPEEEIQLTPTLVDCHQDIVGVPGSPTYSVQNAGVATVTTDGHVTGSSYGATSITLTTSNGNRSFLVRVIGHPLGTSITTIATTGKPWGIAVSSNDAVYVTQIDGSTLLRGDTPVNSLLVSTNLGGGPNHVVFNPAGTTAYVTTVADQSLTAVDPATDAPVNTVALGHVPINLIVSPDGGTVYVTVDIGEVYRIDAGTLAKVDSFLVGNTPNGLAWSPDGSRLYISSTSASFIVVYDAVNHVPVDTFQTVGIPQRMAVSADGNELYVANEAFFTGLEIWDTQTGTRITNLAMEGYGLALSPDNSQIWVTNPTAGSVTVVDRAARTVIRTIVVEFQPHNIAFSRTGTEALIATFDHVTVVR